MFLVKLFNHIWKRAGVFSFLAAIILNLTVAAVPAQAAGETYVWKSTTDVTSFTATGGAGNYASDTTFDRLTTPTNGGATYQATVNYACTDGSRHTDNLVVTLDAANYNAGKPLNPTAGKLTGAADCANFLGSIVVTYPDTDIVNGNATAAPAVECDQGSLSWVFCPVIDNISKHLSNLAISVVTPLLEVNTISQQSTPQLYNVWTHIRDFANVLFILIFFAIIASTILQQDIGGLNPYTIKSTWVRLILAAIMVQFSFYISGWIVDIGNILGGGVVALLDATTSGSAGPPSVSNVIGNLTAGTVAVVGIGAVGLLATWEIAMPVLASIMLAVFVAMLTLGARFLIIAILIVASPLALAAFVLPNTRHYSDDWMELLVRLVMMYPIIVGVFALAGIVNEILPFSTDVTASGVAHVATAIIKPLIAIAAFLAVPASFRLAGKGLTRISGLINGVNSRGRGIIKDRQFYKDGLSARKARQASIMQSLANNPTVSAFSKSDSWTRRKVGQGFLSAGGIMVSSSGNPASIQKNFKTAQAEQVKSLKDFENISASLISDALMAAYGNKEKRDKVAREAPVLLSYMGTLAGRAALASQTSAAGFYGMDHVRQITSSSMASDLRSLQPLIDKSNFKEEPQTHRIDFNGLATDSLGSAVKAYKAADIRDKIKPGALEAAIGRKEKRADGTTEYVVDNYSRSQVKQWVANLSANEVQALFDPSNRAFGSQQTRSLMLQMVANNLSDFRANDNGRAVIGKIHHAINTHAANNDIYMDYYHSQQPLSYAWAKGLDPKNSPADQASMAGDISSKL